MSRHIHVCLSVRGVLRKTNRKLEYEFKNCIEDGEGGYINNAFDIRGWFMDQLAQGREVIPFGDPCQGFDYKKGCPGHEQVEQ